MHVKCANLKWALCQHQVAFFRSGYCRLRKVMTHFWVFLTESYSRFSVNRNCKLIKHVEQSKRLTLYLVFKRWGSYLQWIAHFMEMEIVSRETCKHKFHYHIRLSLWICPQSWLCCTAVVFADKVLLSPPVLMHSGLFCIAVCLLSRKYTGGVYWWYNVT